MVLRELIKLLYLECPICNKNEIVFIKNNGYETRSITNNTSVYITHAHCKSCNSDFIIDWTDQYNPKYIYDTDNLLNNFFKKEN